MIKMNLTLLYVRDSIANRDSEAGKRLMGKAYETFDDMVSGLGTVPEYSVKRLTNLRNRIDALNNEVCERLG